MLKVHYGRRAAVAVFAVTICAATALGAVTVQYSTGGGSRTIPLSNGLDAYVYLDALVNGSVDLTLNVPQYVLLNDASFETTPLGAATGSRSITQSLSIISPAATPSSQSIAQAVWITTTAGGVFDPSTAGAQILVGAYVEFDLGSAGLLKVTPLGGSISGQIHFPANFQNTAEFLLTPEPTSAAAIVAVAGLLLGRRRW